ncbi:MAG: type II toxin-antitoxin system RelE/ParE family toxin [Sulfuricaulis sp.]
MEFIESEYFSRRLSKYLSDEEYSELQWFLTLHPDAGAVIAGTGGIRKLRWGSEGKGKRGGLRVIYYWRRTPDTVILLELYRKNERSDLNSTERRTLRKILEQMLKELF